MSNTAMLDTKIKLTKITQDEFGRRFLEDGNSAQLSPIGKPFNIEFGRGEECPFKDVEKNLLNRLGKGYAELSKEDLNGITRQGVVGVEMGNRTKVYGVSAREVGNPDGFAYLYPAQFYRLS